MLKFIRKKISTNFYFKFFNKILLILFQINFVCMFVVICFFEIRFLCGVLAVLKLGVINQADLNSQKSSCYFKVIFALKGVLNISHWTFFLGHY